MPLAALRPLDDLSERASRRFRLLISAEGTIAQSRDLAVVLHNVSTTGLLLECEADVEVGTSIALSLPELGEVEALVVWNSGGYCGAEFSSPLTPSAVEKVVSSSKVVWPAFSPEAAGASTRRRVAEPVQTFDPEPSRKPPMVVRTLAILSATGILWSLLIWAAMGL